jgi:hypothetical protein
MRTRSSLSNRLVPIVAAAAVLLALAGCVATVSESRDVGLFSSLSASDGVEVHIVVGGGPSVTVTAAQNTLPHVETMVDSDRLRVSVNGSAHGHIRVEVTTPSLTAIDVSSSASVNAEGVAGTSFNAVVSSGATLQATGATDVLTLNASSQATARLGALTATTARINLSSQARAEVRTTDAVAGDVSSQATLTVLGSPARVDVSTSSQGSVVRR